MEEALFVSIDLSNVLTNLESFDESKKNNQIIGDTLYYFYNDRFNLFQNQTDNKSRITPDFKTFLLDSKELMYARILEFDSKKKFIKLQIIKRFKDVNKNQFLSISSLPPEKFSALKKSFPAYIMEIDDIKKVLTSLEESIFIRFFICKENKLKDIKFNEGDRIFVTDDKCTVKTYNIYKNQSLIRNDLYPGKLWLIDKNLEEVNSKVKELKEKEKIKKQSKGKKHDKISIILATLTKNGHCQFKDFNQFWDVMINDTLYGKIFHQANSFNVDEPKESKFTPTSLPLNLILFGPPGTGKTYATKQKAIDILNEKILQESRKLSREDFKEYLIDFSKPDEKNNGQIAFTTFHQSMTYEDFVEGIKPVIENSKEKDKNGEKTISEGVKTIEEPDTKVGNKTTEETKTIEDTKTNVENNSHVGDVKYRIEPGIFKRMCDLAKKAENKDKNFVLIIDEINRGDVSKIFGELITLIEEDKRENVRPEVDKKEYETIEVTLPYSKGPFTVPNNLYIIGTMNTADRSVEALDTALRRRFSFKELMPKYELYKDADKNQIEICKIKIRDILETINQRIEVLLDRDHQIGHSYFLKVDNEKTFLEVIYNKIIPLLQEYFYNDYEKIGMILGDGFVEYNKSKPKFAIFKAGNDYDYSEKKLYSIVDKKSFYKDNKLEEILLEILANALFSLMNQEPNVS